MFISAKLSSAFAAFLATAASITGAATARAVSEEQTQCPAVTVIAARGSEQNENLEPTRYSPEAAWVSNGYEEENIRAFLQFSEQRYRQRTGQSLMRDVQVLALDASVYPAALHLPRLAEVGENMTALETLRRLGRLLQETPAHEIAWNAVRGFSDSLVRGTLGVDDVIFGYEAESGCQPRYVFFGYSQGAVVLSARERDINNATRGRVAGTLYIGNPLLAGGDPSLVGDPKIGVGLVGLSPLNSRTLAAVDERHRLNYCLRDDFVCDAGVESAAKAFSGGGGVHALYFLRAADHPEQATPAEAAMADSFARWVEESRVGRAG
ncbi:cutinase family protein [Corynebacterium sp. zg-331]|uniref:cutinase family protein n=1 Tax=unclassified Corynebacterium TaxID=2624378 RepID=UPI00128AF8E4|nr:MULTISPECIES: cutinase family protein [unclassified Corynebacterium]MBC3185068.1 cutinase family protein [Corynebacterium sp. zg-331]MPV51568.1 cutinase family protein [Corynebacterium sp. zg331]